ncbi:MAG: diguanylate cyclase [Nitrospinota bacterium]
MPKEKILVVDDERDLVLNLKATLVSEGYEVLTANDGENALGLAEGHLPDIILLDIMMPGMDGFEVCKRLKANPKTENLNVIFLSARDMVYSKIKGLDSGADDYITKPFNHDELLARLRVFARIREYKKKLSTMVDFSKSINVLNIEEFKKTLIERISDIYHADLFSILLVDGEGAKLTMLVNNHPDFEDTSGFKINMLDTPLMKRALTQKKCITIDDFSRSEYSTHKRKKYNDDYAMGIPLLIGHEVIGVLNLSGNGKGFFDKPDYTYLMLGAEHLASAVSNVMKHKKIEEMAITDGLTGLYNHRYFYEMLQAEFERATRYGSGLSVIITDIDYFKKINDTYGHLSGDMILREIAKILKKHTRKVDLVARYGGEEFTLLLPETGKEKAAQVAERIRKDVESRKFKGEKEMITVTISLGVEDLNNPEIKTCNDVVRFADNKLYQAKEGGRNRVIV